MVVRIVFWTVLDYRLVVVSVLLYGLSPDPGFFYCFRDEGKANDSRDNDGW